jgi:hypothetical protein
MAVEEPIAAVSHPGLNDDAMTRMIRLEYHNSKSINDAEHHAGDAAINPVGSSKNSVGRIPFQHGRVLKRSYTQVVRSGKKRE